MCQDYEALPRRDCRPFLCGMQLEFLIAHMGDLMETKEPLLPLLLALVPLQKFPAKQFAKYRQILLT